MPKRTDANHKDILKRCREIPGLSVFSTHELGNGFPDIVIGYKGKNYLIEIKDGSKPPSARKLTEAEQKFSTSWMGQYTIANSFTDILSLID